ncbi:MAG: prolyl oligopeptidase family serine peptidase [Candidatus Eisenbacteria bacterium]|nr:prolyl oligopeptidase family serine peptidase [Candidatus Eisenbacteria bacterium]
MKRSGYRRCFRHPAGHGAKSAAIPAVVFACFVSILGGFPLPAWSDPPEPGFAQLGRSGADRSGADRSGAAQSDGEPTSAERRQALITVFQEALRDQRWETAIAAGEQLQPIGPGNETLAYNLACAYARYGKAMPAEQWLLRAAESGFEGLRLVARDPDLALIRGSKGYEAALERMRRNRADGLEEYKAMAAKRPPLVFLPSEFDSTQAAPVIIALHGYGADALDIAGAWRENAAAIGAILVAPDAVRPTPTGQGFQWLYADEGEWRVLETLEYVRARYRIDPRRVVLTGFSQGGNLTLSAGLAHPDLFPALIPMSGFYDPEELVIPTEAATQVRIYLTVGGSERGAEGFARARDAFSRAGYRVRLKTYPGVGHSFPPNHVAELRSALEFVLAAD